MPDSYAVSEYSLEELDARLSAAGNPLILKKLYTSVAEMNADFSGTGVSAGEFVGITPTDAESEDYGKVYVKGSASYVYWTSIQTIDGIQGPQGPAGNNYVLTAADKAAIAQIVLAELPTWEGGTY